MKNNEFEVLYEGTALEAMELKDVLQEHGIIAQMNDGIKQSGLGSIMGEGLNLGATSVQLIVYHADIEKALSIVDPVIDRWDAEDEIKAKKITKEKKEEPVYDNFPDYMHGRKKMRNIPAMQYADKSGQTFIIEFDGMRIETELKRKKLPILEVYVDGKLIRSVSSPNKKERFAVKGREHDHYITVWFVPANAGIPFVSRSTIGTGITIDDIPVQYSVADPLMHIKNAKISVGILLIIFVLKIVFVAITNYNSGASLVGNAIGTSVYFIPLIILFVFFRKYNSSPKRALIAGGVLGSLELVDYLFGVILALLTGTKILLFTILIFVAIRLSVLFSIFQGIKNLRKI